MKSRKILLKKRIDLLDEKIKESFSKVKYELDDHREAINDNTEEVQMNYEYITKLEEKVDILEQKLEKLSLMISVIGQKLNLDIFPEKQYKEKFWLTNKEKEIFNTLFELCEKDISVSLEELSSATGYEPEQVKQYLYDISSKGISIIIRKVADKIYFELDNLFMEAHKKYNLINN